MGVTLPGAAGEVKESYEISNSIRFNDGDSPKLTRTNASDGDRQKFTISFWTKRTTTGATHIFFDVGTSTSADTGSFACSINSSDKLFVGGGATSFRQTNRLFRDTSAWYHIVIAVDSTDGTADNRIKIYVNGVQETSFTTNNAMSQNLNTPVNENGKVHQICNRQKSSSLPFDGYMTEFHFIDGAQKAQTDFGEFNDNGVWVPKRYTGSHGTNGFFLEFKQTGTSANASGIGADTSGNDNHFTPTNLAATDITEDTCTNNFATLNALDHRLGSCTLSEGNCKFVGANGGSGKTVSTIGVTSGKWYAEFKVLNTHKARIGIIDQTGHDANDAGTNDGVDYSVSDGYIYTYLNGTNNDTGNNSSSSGVDLDNPSANDIIGIALDADNEKVRFYRNGTAEGTEGDGFTPLQRTGTGETYFFHVRDGSGSGDDEPQIECNFGNAPFSISSGNTDGKYGNFEYAPPSGFYALCTKRLAEFG